MKNLRFRPNLLILVSALLLAATANLKFFIDVVTVYPLNQGNLGFVISLAVLLTALFALLMSVFSLMLPTRIVVTFFILLAAVTGYYSDQFGVLIDTVMLENILQTDTAEVRDLINGKLITRLLLLGGLATALVWGIPTGEKSRWQAFSGNLATAAASIVVILTCLFSFSGHYASFFREHKTLRYNVNPLMAIYSASKYVAARYETATPTSMIAVAADAEIEEEDDGNELIILVVGETARSDRFSLNGYSRQTNPLLEKEPRLISYSHITSCGTSTAISVPCMFAKNGRSEFDVNSDKYQENALDILARAGVSVLWRDNNSSSKGVADRVAYENYRDPDINPLCDIECRDPGMLAGLQDYIDQQSGDVLIVLHQMGNHGPAYYKRYPREFEKFTPVCKSNELSSCSVEEISNAYDNAILYTDYFLSKVIALLKDNTPKYETAMLYVSDHGESLGEHGLYLHGAPYFIAPEEQTNVPVLLWLGESADIDLQKAVAQKSSHNSHDAVFNSLLSAFEVQSAALDQDSQLFVVEDD
jgi:lipid A ethanolaminephosphotransferase